MQKWQKYEDQEIKKKDTENHEKWKQILNAIEEILKHMGKYKLEKKRPTGNTEKKCLRKGYNLPGLPIS